MGSIIVRHRRLILVFYAIAVVVCVFLSRQVKINENLLDYLPEDAPSTIALHTMENEFDEELSNVQLMVKDISAVEAAKLVDKIAEVDGVTDVTFGQGAASAFDMPIEMLPKSVTEAYYRDGNALFTITIDASKTIDTMTEIRELTGHETAAAGTFVNDKVAQSSSMREVYLAVGLVVVFGIILLMVSLDSWLEPFLLVFGLFVAIILNAGTNVIFGTISNMTNISSSMLQMGVAVDYSIFLLHRFREYRDAGLNAEDGMEMAINHSFVSILSSSLTTIIGFLALCFMKYRIGMDLGLVLAKGIALSLLVAFTFLPAIILACDKWIEKSRRPALLSSAKTFAGISMRITPFLAVIFIAVIGPAFWMSHHNLFYYGNSHYYRDDSVVVKEEAEIREVFGYENMNVILVPKGDLQNENALIRALKENEKVIGVTAYSEMFGTTVPMSMMPRSVTKALSSDNYSRLVITLDANEESDETFALIEELQALVKEYYPEDSYMVGTSASTHDLKSVVSADNLRVNLIAVGAIFVVLLITFRNFLIPFILTLTIEGAIWISMSFTYIAGSHLFYIGYLVVSSVLLGATVDYAILLASRYREERMSRPDKKEAMRRAISMSTVSVLMSGLIFAVAGLLLYLICTNQLVAQLGVLLCRGALTALFVVLTVLPGLLMALDRLIVKQAE